MKTTRCTDCAAEFSDEELQGMASCPTCGTTSVPCSINDDVLVKLNWHELRIIVIWASNYAAEHCKCLPAARTLNSIIKRLEAQHPERAPLTLVGEMREMASVGDVELIHNDGTREKFPKKESN